MLRLGLGLGLSRQAGRQEDKKKKLGNPFLSNSFSSLYPLHILSEFQKEFNVKNLFILMFSSKNARHRKGFCKNISS